MNRLELIKNMAKRAAAPAGYQAKGVHCVSTGVDPVANKKPKDRKRTSGRYDRGSLGPINRPQGLKYDWVKKPDLKPSASFKAVFRHEPHPLTKAAAQWRHLTPQPPEPGQGAQSGQTAPKCGW